MQNCPKCGVRWFLFGATVALIVLHQDWWDWNRVDPRLFGFLPIGLGYHVFYTIACAVLMFLFVRLLWPKHLEDAQPIDKEKH